MRLRQLVIHYICLIGLILPGAVPSGAYGQEKTAEPTAAEEPFDEGLFEDEAAPVKEVAPASPPDPAAPPPLPQRRITLQFTTRLNYYLYPTKEQMELTYRFELSHHCARPKQLAQPLQCAFNGQAPVVTAVQGQLAKWNGGQCQLQVKVPDIPFGVVFVEQSDGSATFKIPSLGPVQEEWTSHCSLAADPEFAFNTIGAPEEWINRGLQKAKDALEQLSMTVSDAYSMEKSFAASAEESDDEIGRATVVVEGNIIAEIVQPDTILAAQH